MWVDDDEFIIRCGCGDLGHYTHLHFDSGHFSDIPEYSEISIYLKPDAGPLWTRIKNAWKYIFQHEVFFHYGGTLMRMDRPEQRDEARRLADFIRDCAEKAEKQKSL